MTRREPRPPDRPTLSASLGPERVAAILSVLVVAVVGTIAVGGANGGTPPSASPAAGSPAAGSPAAATTRPSVAPSSTAAATDAPPSATAAGWASGAATLIEIQDQIIVARDQLATALADPETATSVIARELRALNSAMTTALRAVDTLRADAAPGDLVDDLAVTHRAGLDAGVQTLQASLQNAPAYRTGGAQVVAALAGLEDLTLRLRTEAGLP